MVSTKVRTGLFFYRQHSLVPLLLAIPGCYLYKMGSYWLPVFLMKVATDCLIWYFISAFRSGAFYYYYNLHISKRFLFITWLLADLLIFCTLLWLTTLI